MAGGAAGGYRGVRAGGDHGGVSVQSAPRSLADDTRHSQGVRTNGSLNEAVCRQGSNIKVQIAELVMFGVPLVSNVTRSRLQSRASRVTHPWHTLACRSTGAPGTPWSDAQSGHPAPGRMHRWGSCHPPRIPSDDRPCPPEGGASRPVGGDVDCSSAMGTLSHRLTGAKYVAPVVAWGLARVGWPAGAFGAT